MLKFLLFIISGLLLLFCFTQDISTNRATLLKEFHAAEIIFQHAEKIAENEGGDESLAKKADAFYSRSLQQFTRVAEKAEKIKYDSLLLHATLRKGLIAFYLADNVTAKQEFLKSIDLKKNLEGLPDSLLFLPYMYGGGICYNQNKFDSALLLYKKAEMISDSYTPPLDGTERIYNRLGVMNYEIGNYLQAKNYFEKAIQTLQAKNNSNNFLLANYQINIASLLVKLEEYELAKIKYKDVLQTGLYNNEAYHNLGIINLHEKNYGEALNNLKKIRYDDNKKIIDLYYNLTLVFSKTNKDDSANHYYQKALKENEKWNGIRKNVPLGLLYKFHGDLETNQKNLDSAVHYYQQAIYQFYPAYTSENDLENPAQYSGTFSYLNLFNTLVSKAEILEKKYHQSGQITELEYALNAYQSAFQLAAYVERTYTSDEARLFLGKLKYTAHSKPIDISLQLYNHTKDHKFLEQAWQFDQQNKASVLSLSIIENEIKNSPATSNELIKQELSLKSAITRLSLKSNSLSDSAELVKTIASIRDYEIELGKIRDKIRNDPGYQNINLPDEIPPITEVQQILDAKTGLISFHLSETELITLFISKSLVEYYKLNINNDFFEEIEALRNELYNAERGKKYNGDAVAGVIYRKLFLPFETGLQQLNRIIIIPDDELNYLPFEVLKNEKQNYLLEQFSFTYQYTAALFVSKKSKHSSQNILAFAPFSQQEYKTDSNVIFSKLNNSGDEIKDITGEKLANSEATKGIFLKKVNRFPVIHLATHASVNNKDPLQSFIAFHPSEKDFKLYAAEIYNLRMDSVNLVILSACETGAGQLVKGEGLMSLSRAFAYAGCPNIITSLWKAEDKTTAFLGKRIHYHISRNQPYDIALQKAKLDLLKSREINPGFKTPEYWSNLVFIGNYEPVNTGRNWTWIALFIVILTVAYLILKNKKSKIVSSN